MMKYLVVFALLLVVTLGLGPLRSHSKPFLRKPRLDKHKLTEKEISDLFSHVRQNSVSQIPQYCNDGNDKVTSLPGWSEAKNGKLPTMYAGFIQVNASSNGSIFYWFIEAQNPSINKDDTPILLWLNGGPGASSLTGLFMENGPFRINGTELISHEYTWNNKYHMLFVDNPIGTGFSYCNDDGYVTTEAQMADNFLTFLQQFFNNEKCHPSYKVNPFYITGESYAGRYIPFIAKWVLSNDTTNINLQGLAIGNGIYDPYVQFRLIADYAFTLGILDKQGYDLVQENVTQCFDMAAKGDLHNAVTLCLDATNGIYENITSYGYGGDIFQYNFYQRDPNYFNALTDELAAYLTQNSLSDNIHTYGVPWKSSDGTSSPNPVDDALYTDIILNNSAIFIPDLLSKYRILFYNGQLDGSVCNNFGNQKCLENLNYGGDWYSQPRKVWKTKSEGPSLTAGYVKQSKDKQLTYVVISDSGHLVPFDQPENAQIMIETFVEGNEW